jgi:ADP-ribose pyrophosphatase YjhB (NUDIX family)
MAQPRIAAGALFLDEAGRVMLVRPTYKSGWDIPGGYVEPGESPRDACIREVREELGIEPPIGQLLVVDWAPRDAEGDKILFVFDGGRLDDINASLIELDVSELAEYRYVAPEEFGGLLGERLVRRITAAWDARHSSHPAYLEHGREARPPIANT